MLKQDRHYMSTYTATLLSPTWSSLLVPLVILLFNIEHMVAGGFVVEKLMLF
jgi:hypothetical protein